MLELLRNNLGKKDAQKLGKIWNSGRRITVGRSHWCRELRQMQEIPATLQCIGRERGRGAAGGILRSVLAVRPSRGVPLDRAVVRRLGFCCERLYSASIHTLAADWCWGRIVVGQRFCCEEIEIRMTKGDKRGAGKGETGVLGCAERAWPPCRTAKVS